MKLCYCDETGTGSEPFAVMVGILVDSNRMHVTKKEWEVLLGELSMQAGSPITEIHTKDFYSGNGIWRNIDGPSRSIVIEKIINWLIGRKHKLIVIGVDKEKYYASAKAGQIKSEVNTLWRFMGMHLILAIQRRYQNSDRNKGNTIFIFDNEEREKMNFSDLIWDPPAWSDSYYEKGKKQERLDQVVDVPYFVDSRHSPLVQVADFVAYFIRKHLEIEYGTTAAKYEDEPAKVKQWISLLNGISIHSRSIYPATGRCEVASMFFNHAPEKLRTMLRGKD